MINCYVRRPTAAPLARRLRAAPATMADGACRNSRRDVFIDYHHNPQHKPTLAPSPTRLERTVDTVDDTAYTSCTKASSKPTTTKPETIDLGLTGLTPNQQPAVSNLRVPAPANPTKQQTGGAQQWS